MRKITHIIITAGGTSEPIDGVRRISNTSTGSLCARIYEALSDRVGAIVRSAGKEPEYTVHYVVSATAVRPEPRDSLPVLFYPVTDVRSVLKTLEALMTRYPVGYVIHGMAVSDFTKGYLIERDALAGELAGAVETLLKREGERPAPDDLRETIAQVLALPAGALPSEAKVSSRSELVLSLVRTPKIIEMFKRWNPGVFLVGFKLLKGVPEEELVRVAAGLAEKNGCDLVLANDASRIGPDGHFGLLVKNGDVVGRYGTKMEIAGGIAERLLSARPEQRERGSL